MDTESDKKAGCLEEGTSCGARGKYSGREIKESRTLQESKIETTSSFSRNSQENEKKIKNLYYPVKEKLQVAVEYINILNEKRDAASPREISLLLEFLEMIKNQCDMYLKYKLIETSRNG